MKKEYSVPKLQLIPVEFPDVLALSNGGEGSAGMEFNWNNEIYF